MPSGPQATPPILGAVVAACSLVLAGAGTAGAQPASDAGAAAGRRLVAVPLLASPPRIDCRLDDEAWRDAAALGDFVQILPGDNARPGAATEVRIGLTAEALYVAVRADDDPPRVRTTLGRRDALDQDDTVSLYLDTFHDERRAYVVTVNPLGVQQDGVIVEGREPDLSVDLVFDSRGCLTDSGYAVELAVPFESLRYGRGSWGLHVLRVRRHADEELSWMPLRRDRVAIAQTSVKEVRARFLSQAGLLAGFESLPATLHAEIIPVATVSTTSTRGTAALVNHGISAATGVTARLAFSSGAAIDLAVNPDFAEIEADQLQLTANQRFPLFYDEKRPFFLEEAELLQTPLRAFHSRTVVDPALAVKASAQRGLTSAAVLVAADAAPGTFTAEERTNPLTAAAAATLEGRHAAIAVARARRDLGVQSSLGVLGTGYRFADRYNYVAGADGRIGLGARGLATFQLVATAARQPFHDPDLGAPRHRPGRGLGYFLDTTWANPRTSFQLTGQGYTPDYRAELGYTQRTDTNRWSGMVRFNAEPRPDRTLISWSLMNTALAQFDWEGRMQYAYTYPRAVLAMRRQTHVTLSAYKDYARVFEEELGSRRGPGRPGAFAGPSPERSTVYHGFTLEIASAPTRTLAFEAAHDRSWHALDYDLGAGPRFPRVSPAALADPGAPLDPGPGTSSAALARVTYRPRETMSVTMTHYRSRLVREDTRRAAFDQRLWSLRLQYALSRFTWIRVRLDADSLHARLAQQVLVAWTPTPRSAVYAGYGELGSWLGRTSVDAARLGPYRPFERTWFVKLSWGARARLRRSAPQVEDRAGDCPDSAAWPCGR